MVPLGELCVRALGKAVADDAVLLVVGAAAHAEGRREPFDFLDPDIVGFPKNAGGKFVVRFPVQIEHLAHQVERSEKTPIDVLLHLFQLRLVRNDRVPGKDQDRVVDACRDFQVFQRRLVLQKFAVLQLHLLPKRCCRLFVIITEQELLHALFCMFRIDLVLCKVDRQIPFFHVPKLLYFRQQKQPMPSTVVTSACS